MQQRYVVPVFSLDCVCHLFRLRVFCVILPKDSYSPNLLDCFPSTVSLSFLLFYHRGHLKVISLEELRNYLFWNLRYMSWDHSHLGCSFSIYVFDRPFSESQCKD